MLSLPPFLTVAAAVALSGLVLARIEALAAALGVFLARVATGFLGPMGSTILAQLPSMPDGSSSSSWAGYGLMVGSAIGAAGGTMLAAAGNTWFKPYLESKGHKTRADQLEGRVQASENEIERLRGLVETNEKHKDRLIAQLQSNLATTREILDKNLRLTHNFMVMTGTQKASAPFRVADILIGDKLPEPTGPKVLIVEDSIHSAEVTENLLKLYGFQTKAVGRLDDAVEALYGFDPEFVILDLMLPDGHGEDLLRKIVDEGRTCQVVVTTGKHESKWEEVLSLKPALILKKPFSFLEKVLPILQRVES